MSYAELQVASAFSFLRGASSPEELAATASVLGLSAIGITDLNSVAGVVRMWDAAKEVGIRLVVGARLSFRDATPDLLCYPRDRAAWGRLDASAHRRQGTRAAWRHRRCREGHQPLLPALRRSAGTRRRTASACPRAGSTGCRVPGNSSAPEGGFSRPGVSRRQSPLSWRRCQPSARDGGTAVADGGDQRRALPPA